MSWTTTINGVSYTAPDVGENFWGTQVKNWMQAVGGTGSGQGGMLKKDGGLFQLLAEVNFGTAFGIKALTYTSGSANSGSAAGAGQIRLKRADLVEWRNNADSGNLTLGVSTSNWLQWQSVDLADISSVQTFTNKSISGLTNTISNIALSSIVAPAAGVLYSDGASILSETRLSLSRMAAGTQYYVLMGNGASSPSYQLLTNNSVDASAAIARNKLASGTASHVLINDGSGVMSSEAILNVSRGGTGLNAIGTSNQILGVNNAASSNEYKSLATGTSGTDFTIIHSVGAITFNLPDSSAANRGALTSTDWSTFNNKIGGSGTNGQVALFSAGSTITSNAAIAYSTSANSNTLSLLSGIKIGTNTTVAATAGAGAIRYNAGTLEFSDGAAWNTLGVVGAGIVSLNALTAVTQTFAVGTAGTDFAISSATSTHTFNLPDAGASARGVVTTSTQTFAGVKTFSSNAVFSSYMTVGDVISRDNSDGSVSVSSGQTLWHPNLDIQTGHTYSIAGQMVLVDELTGAGTVDGDGTVFDTSTDLTGYSRLDANESVTGGKTFSQRIEALGGINASGLITANSGLSVTSSTFGFTAGVGFTNSVSGGTFGMMSTVATGSPGMFFDHQGTGNTGTFSFRNGTAGTNTLLTISGTGVLTPSEKIDLTYGQIKFPATQNASADANTLDDYERGTWNPSVGGTATYGANTAGYYTKIGNKVFIEGRVFISTIGSGSTTVISGLPFTSGSNVTNSRISCPYFTDSATAIDSLGGGIGTSATSISLYSIVGTAVSVGSSAIFKNGTVVDFFGFYTV